MGMTYAIEYLDVVVKKHIPALPATAKTIIKQAIQERLTIDPISFGKPLQHSLRGYRRLRVSDYRVIYRIDRVKGIVTIIAILHRKDMYEQI
jgi:addiction module RelE/StbE family toxin